MADHDLCEVWTNTIPTNHSSEATVQDDIQEFSEKAGEWRKLLKWLSVGPKHKSWFGVYTEVSTNHGSALYLNQFHTAWQQCLA